MELKECKRRKVAVVMKEFKEKKLHSSSGYLVKNPKQAIAIALSVSNRYCPEVKKKKTVKRKSRLKVSMKKKIIKKSMKRSMKKSVGKKVIKKTIIKKKKMKNKKKD
jgi:hypothetical protein